MVNNDIDELDKKIAYFKKLRDFTSLWSSVAVIYYVVQNIYFFCVEGWHTKALSDTERLVDSIGSLLFLCAVFMFARTLWRMMDVVIAIIDLD